MIGHGWHAWRPKEDVTCLPCLRLRRMDELCRSSTFSRIAVVVMRCWLRTPVELLQSSYTSDTMVRQGSRFAPTLPYQAFNPFGVGEVWRDKWHGENGIWYAEEGVCYTQVFFTQVFFCTQSRREGRMLYTGVFHTGVFFARRAAESLEFCICDAEERGW